MEAATKLCSAPVPFGGIAASLGCSALLHGALVLLPPGLAGTENSAFAAVPALAAKSQVPLVVHSLRHTRLAEPPPPPVTAPLPPPTQRRPRVVELSAAVTPPRPVEPPGMLMFDQYFKASALSTPPGLYTLGPTEPEPERDDAMAGSGRLVIELFLSESGAIEYWQVVEETSPPAFRQHVLNTFLAATYTPGRLFERAVKSRLKVEASLAPDGKYLP